MEWELKGLAYIYSPSLTKEGSWRPGVTDFWDLRSSSTRDDST